jgi:hypothetical protein
LELIERWEGTGDLEGFDEGFRGFFSEVEDSKNM